MSLQRRYLCKFPVSSMFSSAAPEMNYRYLHKVALAVLQGAQQLLPLKVAPIQPSVTAAFHLQSRRDSNCQMWEFWNWNCSSIPIPIPELELELKLVELKMELELKTLELELELELNFLELLLQQLLVNQPFPNFSFNRGGHNLSCD